MDEERRRQRDPNTIGYLLEQGFRLHAICYREGCRRTAELDLARLVEQLGPDHSTLRKDLCPRLYCNACKGKDVGTWTSGGGHGPSGGAYGRSAYSPHWKGD